MPRGNNATQRDTYVSNSQVWQKTQSRAKERALHHLDFAKGVSY